MSHFRLERAKENFARFEAFTACIFNCLIKMGKIEEVKKMLVAIPNLANLPIFLLGGKIQFPINAAIQTINYDLINLLHKNGAMFAANAASEEEESGRPRVFGDAQRNGETYGCFVPIRCALTASTDLSNQEKEKLLQFLIERGACIDDPRDPYRKQRSLVHQAVETADVFILKWLLEHQVNPNTHNWKMFTPLYEALDFYTELYCELLESDNSKSDQHDNMLLKGISIRRQIVILLLQNGAQCNDIFCPYHEQLVALVALRDYDLAKMLVEKGVDPHEKDNNGYSAAQVAYANYTSSRNKKDLAFCLFLQT